MPHSELQRVGSSFECAEVDVARCASGGRWLDQLQLCTRWGQSRHASPDVGGSPTYSQRRKVHTGTLTLPVSYRRGDDFVVSVVNRPPRTDKRGTRIAPVRGASVHCGRITCVDWVLAALGLKTSMPGKSKQPQGGVPENFLPIPCIRHCLRE